MALKVDENLRTDPKAPVSQNQMWTSKSRSMLILSLGLIFLVPARLCSSVQFDSSSMTAQLEKGKRELEDIEKFAYRSRLPQNGECWKEALIDLRLSCSELTEETQSRMAISFTQCFTEMMGKPSYLCTPRDSIKDCLHAMDDQGIHSFRQFFLHTMDMCHYIQSELWQLETDRAVNQ